MLDELGRRVRAFPLHTVEDPLTMERKATTATLVSKILRGTPPGDLPVEIPRRVRVLLFPDRASVLGYEMTPEALALADQIVEDPQGASPSPGPAR